MSRALGVMLAALFLAVSGAAGQESVRVDGAVGHPAATRLREILARDDYLLLTRDTVLPPSSRIAGDLLIATADVRLEGSVAGDAAVLPGGELFLRPGSRVGGALVSLGGAVFPSANSTHGDRLELPASVETRLARSGDGYTLRLTPPPDLPLLRPTGFFGLGLPTYDRVNGATLRLGAQLRLRADSTAPIVSATLLYHQARETPGAEIVLSLTPRSRYDARVEAARRTETNDAWIRGGLVNSLAVLLVRSDVRDYHEADQLSVHLARRPTVDLQAGEGFLAPRVRLAASRARSLPTREVWTLFDDEWRANPAIDEGDIVSAALGAAAGWRGVTSTFDGAADVEVAPAGPGDFGFAQVTADARWETLALRGHTLSMRGRLVHALGTGAPRQRWAILGGPGTLPTLETGSLRGDNLVFVESTYVVPVAALTIPVLGKPSFLLRHSIGSAWVSDDAIPPLDQSLGAGVAFPLAQALLSLDPTDRERLVLSIGATLPF